MAGALKKAKFFGSSVKILGFIFFDGCLILVK